MIKYEQDLSARVNGNNLQPLAGAEVRVTDKATGLPAALYQDDELTPIPQPLITTNTGYFGFKAANGEYELRFSPGPNSSRFDSFTRDCELYDADDVPNPVSAVMSSLGAEDGAGKVGFKQTGIAAAVRSVFDKLSDFVSVKDFGAKGDGVTDDTAAIQAATNTGKAVYFPDGTYKMLGMVSYAGRVAWFGNGRSSVILNDGPVLTVTGGTGSVIDNLHLTNITAPLIIHRNPDDWTAVPVLVQSNGPGYQPTVNDLDVWPTLTDEQKNQDIGPRFIFQGDASDIEVSRISGRFVSILMYDAVRSVVRDCRFSAGKNFAGGIVFWNINGQEGKGNQALRNVIEYASYSGVAYARNIDGKALGNTIERCGESGVKTWQNTTGGVDARCYRMRIKSNDLDECYYDGLDASADYPHTGTVDTRHIITGNRSRGNRRAGYFGDGMRNIFSGNRSDDNWLSGYHLTYNFSVVLDNHAFNCNLSNAASGEHQMQIIGDDNVIRDNVNHRLVANGYALYAPGRNKTGGNHAFGGVNFLGNVGAISSTNEGNTDAATGLRTPQAFQFVLYNNGGTISHIIRTDGITGGASYLSSRINGAESGLTATPTGSDAATSFAAGAKLSSASLGLVILDTAAQNVAWFDGLAVIDTNESGTALTVRAGVKEVDVNGVNRARVVLEFLNATTGAPFDLATIPSGKAVCVKFQGNLA